MRLQSENRRVSQASLGVDTSRGLPLIGGPPANKRASFTPLTGTGATWAVGHKRISSFSDAGTGYDSPPKDLAANPILVADSVQLPSNPRRLSGMFRGSPPMVDYSPDLISADVVALRTELNSVKQELEDMRNELCDANEAREASETCVKALRAFIAENNVGGPPTAPAVTTGEDAQSRKNGKGWAFKIWKVDSPVKSAPTNSLYNSGPPTRTIAAQTTAPLSKKLGEFFSSRTSFSSNNSAPPVSSISSAREAMYQGSDSSSVEDSVVEPVSPRSEGMTDVVVRGSLSPSSSPELLDQMKSMREVEVELS
jgi:hypothetical protein